ncbi:TetR/AcrR family transcriptional regulator [Gordonia sp. LSe1-13]|uniref:TetR/AcrR family transcriptional regulator n=1 Tax=Gordonia sesuvii TaxID=3116777 RepID=A0ABU7MEJ7_9ACTN|nr:TetR/AcrR family transcriptional regulator [Gordonia sp. LSe1-13]
MSTPSRHGRAGGSLGGRPRNEAIDVAALDATLEILTEKGYPRLSFEEVAQRAGTSRPALYRRWPDRPSLALSAIGRRLSVPHPPDTGCTLCDFAESFTVFLSAHRTIRPEILSAVYADCAEDENLRQAYVATVITPTRCAVAETLDRAVRRGDIRDDVNREQILDFLASLVHYRALFDRSHLTDSEAMSAVTTLLRGVAVDYDALLAHSRELEADHHDSH